MTLEAERKEDDLDPAVGRQTPLEPLSKLKICWVHRRTELALCAVLDCVTY